jgi:RNA recognition motif-containing protein
MGKRVFVGNLPFSATEEELRQLFSQHGDVVSAEIVKDRYTERSRGFGFVEMATDEGAAAAVAALNQYQMAGRPLTVNEARARAEGDRGGRRGGRSEGPSGNRW